MTAKEKAIQLYEKFYYKIPTLLDEKTLDCLAQECALITVDEIEKEIHTYYERFKYWQEVKQEIEKL
jgi:hypothetical protein